MKKIKLPSFLKKRYVQIALFICITFFITRYIYWTNKNQYMYEVVSSYKKHYGNDKFNLKQVPSGYVISIVGVTNTHDSLMLALLPHMRFHEFEVSILNPETRIIHSIIVPQYAIHAFKIGIPVLNGTEEQYQRPPQQNSNKPKFNNI